MWVEGNMLNSLRRLLSELESPVEFSFRKKNNKNKGAGMPIIMGMLIWLMVSKGQLFLLLYFWKYPCQFWEGGKNKKLDSWLTLKLDLPFWICLNVSYTFFYPGQVDIVYLGGVAVTTPTGVSYIFESFSELLSIVLLSLSHLTCVLFRGASSSVVPLCVDVICWLKLKQEV